MNIYNYEEFNAAIAKGNTTDNDDMLLRTFMDRRFMDYFKLKNLEGKTHRYLVTFTLKNDDFDEDEVHKYIEKQLHRKPLKIVQAYLVKEYTKAGRAHWHSALETTKPLKKDRFQYYIKQYGLIDISKTKAQNIEEGINYTSKDSKAIKII